MQCAVEAAVGAEARAWSACAHALARVFLPLAAARRDGRLAQQGTRLLARVLALGRLRTGGRGAVVESGLAVGDDEEDAEAEADAEADADADADALAEAGADYAQFADEFGASGELNGERLLLNVAVEPDEAGTYAIDPGWTPGWVGEATNPSAPPDSAIHATYTRPPCEKAKKAKAKGKLRATIPQKNAAEFMRKVGTLYDAFATAAQRVLQRDVNSGKLDRLIHRMEGRVVPFGYHVRVLHLSAGEGIIAPPGADSQSYHKDELEEKMWQVCCCHARVCSETVRGNRK